MEDTKHYLALDIGAGSGRALIGSIGRNAFNIREVHRFENKPIWMQGTLYWDILFIWDNVLEALKRCAASGAKDLAGIGIDTWNCDFGLVDRNGVLLCNPICYRDKGAVKIQKYFREKIDEKELYQITGIGFNTITALSRFIYIKRFFGNWLLDAAATYLPLPGLLSYFLTGIKKAEETILWGSQLVDIKTRTWNRRLTGLFEIPNDILPHIVPPGTILGNILPEVQKHTGIQDTAVIAVAGHDTISASVALCTGKPDTAFVSVGTWSVFGILLSQPETSDRAFQKGFLNELAVDSILFAKNMMGFYILEALIRIWRCRGVDCSYETLIKEASNAPEFELHLDVNDPAFFSAVNIEATVYEYLKKTGQKQIHEIPVLTRSIFESLAFSYKETITDLEQITERKLNRLVVLGGGAKNRLLCQMVADAIDREVVAGPPEATAIGNIGIQALATNLFSSIGSVHNLIKRSFPGKTYIPIHPEEWQQHAEMRGCR